MQEQLLTIILVALVLGLDAFSLATGMGLKGVSRRFEMKFSSTVGVFHVLMPLVGLELGLTVGRFMGVWASRLGAVILLCLAVSFFIKGYKESRPQRISFSELHQNWSKDRESPEQNWGKVILLALSVSMDALTVGFSLGTFKMPILISVVIMGSTAALMTALGFIAGKLASRLIGSYAQMTGGILLFLLAIKLAFF
ncbi:manganese efflux pump MntP [Syntrophomonas palmitatica]|uniref:manganese efflux pump MntP n=1 Tax=Syntrophomonas palmitatica TaxID=402877 RepID=UPI0006D296C0|nr:manganese efflux pump [Syntrophomonas palmitatica]